MDLKYPIDIIGVWAFDGCGESHGIGNVEKTIKETKKTLHKVTAKLRVRVEFSGDYLVVLGSGEPVCEQIWKNI